MRSSIVDFQRTQTPGLEERDQTWFAAQLSARCPELSERGADFIIRCPFHSDNKPSLGVDKHKGIFHCFACSANGGWNKLAAKLGMEKLRRHSSDRPRGIGVVADDMTRSLTRLGVKTTRSEAKGDINRPLVKPWPEADRWRDIEGEFLVRLGCIAVTDLRSNSLRIGLPVRDIEGDLLGYTCRAVHPADAQPKYLPLAADAFAWREKELPVQSAIFLLDRVFADDWRGAVLVEGPYDALRLYANGVPALAILGTSSWTARKAATIAGLGLACIVMMDSDEAGLDAQQRVLASLENKVPIAGLRLPAGCKDPGELTIDQIEWVRAKLTRLSGTLY